MALKKIEPSLVGVLKPGLASLEKNLILRWRLITPRCIQRDENDGWSGKKSEKSQVGGR